MKRWYVVTPSYESGGDYFEPPEHGADVIEVFAKTKRAAVTEGVKRMLAASWRQFRWCRDARSDGVNPFKGVKAIEVEDDEPATTGGQTPP
jgi:hypothetical protein